MTTDYKVTELFWIIDEFCKHFDAENAGNLLEDNSGVKRRRRAASLSDSVQPWEHIVSLITSQSHCKDTASKTTNSCHYSKGKTTSFSLLLLPTPNGMGRRRFHAAFISQKHSVIPNWGRRFKNCLPKNANGWSHRCRSISVRSIPCLPMNGRKSVNDTRNIMAAISVTMPSGSFGSSLRLASLWLQEV